MTDQTTLKNPTNHSVQTPQEYPSGTQADYSMNPQRENNPQKSNSTNNNSTIILSVVVGGLLTMLVGFGSTAFIVLNRNNPETPVATPELETPSQPEVTSSPEKETTIIDRSLETTREIAPETPATEGLNKEAPELPDARSQETPDSRAESDPSLDSQLPAEFPITEEFPLNDEAPLTDEHSLPE